MKLHTCMDDQVLLSWQSSCVPRHGSTTYTLQQLRNRSGELRPLNPVSFAVYDVFHRVIGNNGIIQMQAGMRLTRSYVGRELAQYNGAVEACFNSAKGFLQAFEDAILEQFREIGSIIENDEGLAEAVNLRTVSAFMTARIFPQLDKSADGSWRLYANIELRNLRTLLESRLSVPHELLYG